MEMSVLMELMEERAAWGERRRESWRVRARVTRMVGVGLVVLAVWLLAR